MARKTHQKVTVYETHLLVEGAGRFPLDMLRYDSCFPATSEDASAMEHDRGTRFVVLRRRALVTEGPTTGRWASFGWYVRHVAAENHECIAAGYELRSFRARAEAAARVGP